MNVKSIVFSIIISASLMGCGMNSSVSVQNENKNIVNASDKISSVSEESSVDFTSVQEDKSEDEQPIEVAIELNNIIKDVAAEYNGNNDAHGGLPCVINEDAVVYGINWEEAKNLYLTKTESVILFSAPGCPYCKSDFGIITDAAVKTNTPIYYVNAEKYPRTEYTMRMFEDGTSDIVVQQPGSEGYDELVDLFVNDGVGVISSYYVHNSDGERVKTDYPKIYVPAMISITKDSTSVFSISREIYDSSDGLQENEVEPLMQALVDFMSE